MAPGIFLAVIPLLTLGGRRLVGVRPVLAIITVGAAALGNGHSGEGEVRNFS